MADTGNGPGRARQRLERLRRAALLGGSVLSMLVLGCGLIMDLGRFQEVPVDAGSDAPVGPYNDGGPWWCLSAPNETLDPSRMVTVTIKTWNAVQPFSTAHKIDGGADLDIEDYTPVPGVPVRACPSPVDPQCNSTGTPFQLTDDAGITEFTVPETWIGFFEADPVGLIPETVYTDQLLAGQSAISFGSPVQSQDTLSALAPILGVPVRFGPDSGVGQIFIGVFDCQDHNAAGVSFTLSNLGTDTVVYYNQNGIPSGSATQTDTTIGGGGAANVPTGTTTVTATLRAGSIPLGGESVVVRSGAIIAVNIRVRTH